MPYAADDIISESPIEGGIEITQEEHDEALEAMLSGKRAVVRGGKLRILRPETRTVYGPDGVLEISVDDDVPEGYSTKKPPEPEPEPEYEPSEREILLEALREKVTPEERQAARDRLINERNAS